MAPHTFTYLSYNMYTHTTHTCTRTQHSCMHTHNMPTRTYKIYMLYIIYIYINFHTIYACMCAHAMHTLILSLPFLLIVMPYGMAYSYTSFKVYCFFLGGGGGGEISIYKEIQLFSIVIVYMKEGSRKYT